MKQTIPENTFNFHQPLPIFLLLLIAITIFFSFIKKSSRKTLVIIDGKKSIDRHRNVIQTLSEKYSKVSYSDFTGKLELDLEKSKEIYNKVILLSALRERPEDIQLKLYNDLQRLWKKNLVIFYVKLSKGSDFHILNCESTQVNLDIQDYSNHKVKENIKTLLDTSFLEEFRGTISFCLGLLLICVLTLSQMNIEYPITQIDPAKQFFGQYNHRILNQKIFLSKIMQKSDNSQAFVNDILKGVNTSSQVKSQQLLTISSNLLDKNPILKGPYLEAQLQKEKIQNAKLKKKIEDLQSRTLFDYLKQTFQSLVS